MSRREFRPKRWEQKANVRPGKRARMYRYTQYDVDLSYDRGIIRGTMDTTERHRRRDDLLRRLSDAAEQGGDALEQLAEELDAEEERGWWSGPEQPDIDALAREVGVLDGEEDQALWDSVPDPAESVVVEIEQWLRERGREQD